jgi:hypothetical protein
LLPLAADSVYELIFPGVWEDRIDAGRANHRRLARQQQLASASRLQSWLRQCLSRVRQTRVVFMELPAEERGHAADLDACPRIGTRFGDVVFSSASFATLRSRRDWPPAHATSDTASDFGLSCLSALAV